jgi:6-pyruvoyltetrahydropterin/6-carboxytetrahydropterin synthase
VTTERFGIRLDKQYFNFGSAHFLIFADGTREELHGHNYRATLELDAALDAGHMVADFIVVKPLFKRCCDALDHRTLLPLEHPRLRVQVTGGVVEVEYLRPEGGSDRFAMPERDVRLLPIANTSSELLARHLANEFGIQLKSALPGLDLQRIRVTVEESPGQSAWVERTYP